jgi:hypothetical protein
MANSKKIQTTVFLHLQSLSEGGPKEKSSKSNCLMYKMPCPIFYEFFLKSMLAGEGEEIESPEGLLLCSAPVTYTPVSFKSIM